MNATAPADSAPTDAPCPPCRGTGQVVSQFGGESKPVTCPWCEGSGLRPPPEHDAQAAWVAERGGGEAPPAGEVDGSTSDPSPA